VLNAGERNKRHEGVTRRPIVDRVAAHCRSVNQELTNILENRVSVWRRPDLSRHNCCFACIHSYVVTLDQGNANRKKQRFVFQPTPSITIHTHCGQPET
jgi:hypothetical protein